MTPITEVNITVKRPKIEPWVPRDLPIEVALEKMWKNEEKAVMEHVGSGYISLEQLNLKGAREYLPVGILKLEAAVFAKQGIRKTMEDEHFFQEIEGGVMAGVLDGHCGSAVAGYVKDQWLLRFQEKLAAFEGNVHKAFETLIYEINDEVLNNYPGWNHMGTTAVISFIDTKSHRIYTATIGDSEAKIYRKIDGEFQCIPLSCLRNWTSKSDRRRGGAGIEKQIEDGFACSKELRYPYLYQGINVSRAIGDKNCRGLDAQTGEPKGVSEKPKIGMSLLLPGDRLIFTCDGVEDFVGAEEVIGLLKSSCEESIAEDLAEYALYDKESCDNITVLEFRVGIAEGPF